MYVCNCRLGLWKWRRWAMSAHCLVFCSAKSIRLILTLSPWVLIQTVHSAYFGLELLGCGRYVHIILRKFWHFSCALIKSFHSKVCDVQNLFKFLSVAWNIICSWAFKACMSHTNTTEIEINLIQGYVSSFRWA